MFQCIWYIDKQTNKQIQKHGAIQEEILLYLLKVSTDDGFGAGAVSTTAEVRSNVHTL